MEKVLALSLSAALLATPSVSFASELEGSAPVSYNKIEEDSSKKIEPLSEKIKKEGKVTFEQPEIKDVDELWKKGNEIPKEKLRKQLDKDSEFQIEGRNHVQKLRTIETQNGDRVEYYAASTVERLSQTFVNNSNSPAAQASLTMYYETSYINGTEYTKIQSFYGKVDKNSSPTLVSLQMEMTQSGITSAGEYQLPISATRNIG